MCKGEVTFQNSRNSHSRKSFKYLRSTNRTVLVEFKSRIRFEAASGTRRFKQSAARDVQIFKTVSIWLGESVDSRLWVGAPLFRRFWGVLGGRLCSVVARAVRNTVGAVGGFRGSWSAVLRDDVHPVLKTKKLCETQQGDTIIYKWKCKIMTVFKWKPLIKVNTHQSFAFLGVLGGHLSALRFRPRYEVCNRHCNKDNRSAKHFVLLRTQKNLGDKLFYGAE